MDHDSHTYNTDITARGWKEYYGKGVANAEGLNKHDDNNLQFTEINQISIGILI